MNDSAIQSMPASSAASRSAISFGASAATGTTVSGRLTPLRLDILPPTSTCATMRCGETPVATRRSLPSSISSASPGLMAAKISGCGSCTRLASPGVASPSKVKFWPLQIDQDADRPVVIGLDGTDRGHEFAHLVVIGVTHIDAEHVGAGFEQPADHGAVRRGGTQRGHDFGPPLPPHGVFFPGAGVDVAPVPAGGALS